jgi:hypothetical protein
MRSPPGQRESSGQLVQEEEFKSKENFPAGQAMHSSFD